MKTLSSNQNINFIHVLKTLLALLVIGAIVVGNSAYQGSNLTDASLGAEAIWGDTAWRRALAKRTALNPWALLLGFIASAILWQGNYQRVEHWLIGLVLLMSLAFISSMLLTRPDLGAMLRGLFVPTLPDGATLTIVPTLPDGATLTIIALIGTTVVPYSLFSHAASAAQNGEQRIRQRRWASQQPIYVPQFRWEL
ncbi:hypothetical protein GCM10010919_21100 [Alishewanella longhuensis]|uniref:Uncharacterized protein n=1 Tax=Alishewanella longhuensis TaxID=1091037 RepID=A0ABQ3KZT3_9ALTE|nr:divalent metal cation transporter [Alishewanella longhuensis]GHG70439.1 hypothetical protein GCM10010919_21100 [Alishewanella longhuensis]